MGFEINFYKGFKLFSLSLCRDLNTGLPPLWSKIDYQGGTLPGCVTQANC